MIEVNLIPDVKQELLKARVVRRYVISSTVIVGMAAVGVVVLLGLLWISLGVRGALLDDSITKKGTEYRSVSDLEKTLTIQNQLSALTAMHDKKNIDSRVFPLLDVINPASPNNISISSTKIDAENKTITIGGQASNGYEAAEIFKKTILGTRVSYIDGNGASQSKLLTDSVSSSDMSTGEDATGKKVLRFSFSFVYPAELFEQSSSQAIIERPGRKNVTDSYLRVPQSLFSDREGGQQ